MRRYAEQPMKKPMNDKASPKNIAQHPPLFSPAILDDATAMPMIDKTMVLPPVIKGSR